MSAKARQEEKAARRVKLKLNMAKRPNVNENIPPPTSPQSVLAEATTLAATVLPTDMKGKLVASLLIDAIGSSSYLLPILGEGFDLAWAPISMILVGAMYDGVMPNLKYVALAEELLPFTDIIPTATLGWLREFGPEIVEAKMGERRNKRTKHN